MNRKIVFLVAGLVIALVTGIAIAAAVYTITSNTLTFPIKPASTPSPSSSPNPQASLTLEGRSYYPQSPRYVFERDGVIQNEAVLFVASFNTPTRGLNVTLTLTKVGDLTQRYVNSELTDDQGKAIFVVPAYTLSVGDWNAVANVLYG